MPCQVPSTKKKGQKRKGQNVIRIIVPVGYSAGVPAWGRGEYQLMSLTLVPNIVGDGRLNLIKYFG